MVSPRLRIKQRKKRPDVMEWIVAGLTVVFGIISIALWINYCSVGETDRQNSKGDIKPMGSTSVADPDIADGDRDDDGGVA